MFITVRQYGKPIFSLTTRARKQLTEHDIARAEAHTAVQALEVGYFDIVLTRNPQDARYDVDSYIAIK